MINYPHLPPKSCSIKAHRWFDILPLAGFVILLSGLCSMAVALSVTTWFLPSLMPGAQINYNGAVKSYDRVVVDPILDRKIKQSMLGIYDSRQKVGGEFYKESAFVSYAALLSSDGWAVAGELNGQTVQSRKYWEAIDAQGFVYNIDQFVLDPLSDLVYFKLKSEGFRVMELMPWSELDPNQAFWSVGKREWREIFFDNVIIQSDATDIFSIWKQQSTYSLSPLAGSGTMILNTKGELAGFVDGDENILPGWLITSQLSHILSSGTLDYYGLPYQGYMAERLAGEVGVSAVFGFFVSYSPNMATSSTIGQGDLIIKINGQQVDKLNLARLVLLSPDEITLTVLRDGEEIDIITQKIKVLP